VEFASRGSRRPTENVVPLINVVFLLLVFFMLTGTLSPPQPIEVEPPTAAGTSRPNGASQLLVAADGALALDGDSVSLDELVDRLHSHLRPVPGPGPGPNEGYRERPSPLEVRADHRVAARIFLPLLERLQDAGVSRVDLVTREP
jgi:biopolymer transport protein ExbD